MTYQTGVLLSARVLQGGRTNRFCISRNRFALMSLKSAGQAGAGAAVLGQNLRPREPSFLFSGIQGLDEAHPPHSGLSPRAQALREIWTTSTRSLPCGTQLSIGMDSLGVLGQTGTENRAPMSISHSGALRHHLPAAEGALARLSYDLTPTCGAATSASAEPTCGHVLPALLTPKVVCFTGQV